MYQVYVLAKNGKPLMPTKRFGKVRRMLKNGEAKAIKSKPFTIQLLYETTYYTQPLILGVDPKFTSQICSKCGFKSKKNRKSQSKFECNKCGFKINADHNAACNILARGLALA